MTRKIFHRLPIKSSLYLATDKGFLAYEAKRLNAIPRCNEVGSKKNDHNLRHHDSNFAEPPKCRLRQIPPLSLPLSAADRITHESLIFLQPSSGNVRVSFMVLKNFIHFSLSFILLLNLLGRKKSVAKDSWKQTRNDIFMVLPFY